MIFYLLVVFAAKTADMPRSKMPSVRKLISPVGIFAPAAGSSGSTVFTSEDLIATEVVFERIAGEFQPLNISRLGGE